MNKSKRKVFTQTYFLIVACRPEYDDEGVTLDICPFDKLDDLLAYMVRHRLDTDDSCTVLVGNTMDETTLRELLTPLREAQSEKLRAESEAVAEKREREHYERLKMKYGLS